MFRNTIQALGLCAILGLATPGHTEEPMQVRVPAGDLNLKSDAGTDVLRHRLHRAAAMICGPYSPRDLTQASAAAKCRRGLGATIGGSADGQPGQTLAMSAQKSASVFP